MRSRNPFLHSQNPFLTNDRHRVFVSYYHAGDQGYRERFEMLFSDFHDIMVSESVEIGDINPYLNTETIRQKIRDEYLRDSTVTVVLVGPHTWQRKFVDWEIGSSIRKTQYNSRSGLLGILLPTFPCHTILSGTLPPAFQVDIRTVFDENGRRLSYDSRRIPPRLHDNIERGLDVSSALLSVIGHATWYSPWVPYEIGGARGRQRFFKPFTPYSSSDPPPVPHPLIAHYLHDRQQKKAPAYIALGTPLVTLAEVTEWAKSVAGILRRIRDGMTGNTLLTETRQVQDLYGVQDIYEKNVRNYVY